jgi:hypothetical protein
MTAEGSADSVDRARLRKLNADIERLLNESQLYEAARLNTEAQQLARRMLRVQTDAEGDDDMRFWTTGRDPGGPRARRRSPPPAAG